jgi:hypothetical protein
VYIGFQTIHKGAEKMAEALERKRKAENEVECGKIN